MGIETRGREFLLALRSELNDLKIKLDALEKRVEALERR
jgi:hypothetical protein